MLGPYFGDGGSIEGLILILWFEPWHSWWPSRSIVPVNFIYFLSVELFHTRQFTVWTHSLYFHDFSRLWRRNGDLLRVSLHHRRFCPRLSSVLRVHHELIQSSLLVVHVFNMGWDEFGDVHLLLFDFRDSLLRRVSDFVNIFVVHFLVGCGLNLTLHGCYRVFSGRWIKALSTRYRFSKLWWAPRDMAVEGLVRFIRWTAELKVLLFLCFVLERAIWLDGLLSIKWVARIGYFAIISVLGVEVRWAWSVHNNGSHLDVVQWLARVQIDHLNLICDALRYGFRLLIDLFV